MFNVYCYNVQPGVLIDYETGENYLGEDLKQAPGGDDTEGVYVLNTKSLKFHSPECSGLEKMNPKNREDYEGSRADLIEIGYSPCGTCEP